MAALKRNRKEWEALAERFDLPEEALLGAVKVTVTDGRQARIENHRGLLEQSAELLRIRTGSGRVTVSGSDLALKAMDRKELLICGTIHSVEWE